MGNRLGVYKNKSTIDFEFVAAMDVMNKIDVRVIFKSGAVVILSNYEDLAVNYQNYMKSKYHKDIGKEVGVE